MKEYKKNLLYWAVAAVVVASILLVILWKPAGKKVDIVFLGDSIFGNVTYETHLVDIVAERTGMTTFNGAFGGTCMAQVEPEQAKSESSMWSMAKLAEAICYGDFQAQIATMSYSDAYRDIHHTTMEYYPQRMKELSEIDFSQVKILFIEHGTNDYNLGTPPDNAEDPFDITTFGGALRSSLQLLRTTYPDLRIILMTPIYCELGENGEKKSYNTSYGGGTLDEYVAKEKEIAAQYGIEVLDAYYECGIWEENADEYLADNMHPSEEGQQLLGDFISEYLLQE